jgi:hypothetical protein
MSTPTHRSLDYLTDAIRIFGFDELEIVEKGSRFIFQTPKILKISRQKYLFLGTLNEKGKKK